MSGSARETTYFLKSVYLKQPSCITKENFLGNSNSHSTKQRQQNQNKKMINKKLVQQIRDH